MKHALPGKCVDVRRSRDVLAAIIKKRLDIPESPYTMLQILGLALFERASLNQLLTGASEPDYKNHGDAVAKQLNLFD
ncbi:MAG TPA: hypothetical protein DIW77_06595 [Chromatiaceae bacterium]|jgi:hypothetical protein|nr:hypothetical protein [Chromatiaceae bacterium]